MRWENGGWDDESTEGEGADGSSGSWRGTGSTQSPSDPHPGTVLGGDLYQSYIRATTNAINILTEQECCIQNKPYRVPKDSPCHRLFHGNPMGMGPYNLLADYVIIRNGEGVKDNSGNIPCNLGYPAWTKCCSHSPYIFVCNQFENLPESTAAAILIHEVLHVAGQREDTDTSIGPGDPPNTHQLTEGVRKACGL